VLRERIEEAWGRQAEEAELGRIFDEGGVRAESELLRRLWRGWPHFRAGVSRRQISNPVADDDSAGIVEYRVLTNSGTVLVYFPREHCAISGVAVVVPALGAGQTQERPPPAPECASPADRATKRHLEMPPKAKSSNRKPPPTTSK
jgi:hypothetical protein